MSHYVICPICEKKFDRDKIAFIQVSARRYAHKECADGRVAQKTQDEKDFEDLIQYIKDLLKIGTNGKIIKQIHNFKKEYNYTYSGMLGSLKYFYEVQGNSIDKANHGIGIIPWVYEEAKEYYSKITFAKEKNKDIKFNTKTISISIFSPKPEKKLIKLFDLDKEIDNE